MLHTTEERLHPVERLLWMLRSPLHRRRGRPPICPNDPQRRMRLGNEDGGCLLVREATPIPCVVQTSLQIAKRLPLPQTLEHATMSNEVAGLPVTISSRACHHIPLTAQMHNKTVKLPHRLPTSRRRSTICPLPRCRPLALCRLFDAIDVIDQISSTHSTTTVQSARAAASTSVYDVTAQGSVATTGLDLGTWLKYAGNAPHLRLDGQRLLKRLTSSCHDDI